MDDLRRERPVTLQDVADRCGVAKATVSRALNGNPEINSTTAARIRDMAAALGYDPAHFHQARRLAARRSGRRVLNHQVALLLPAYFHTSRYFSELFHGLLNTLTPRGYGISISIIPGSHADAFPLTFHPGIVRGEIDGVVLVGHPSHDKKVLPQLRRHLRDYPCPIVTMILPNAGCASVVADDAQGGYLAAQHLIAQGHRHIVYVYDGIEHHGFFRRRDGLWRALREANIEFDPWTSCFPWCGVPIIPHHLETTGALLDSDAAGGESSLLRLLREQPDITALLAQNDVTALQIWYLLRSAGYRIPEDISLVGYDDSDPLLDARGRNMLTTIALPLREIGQRAAELLLHQIDTAVVEATGLTLGVELVRRKTTRRAPAAGAGPRPARHR